VTRCKLDGGWWALDPHTVDRPSKIVGRGRRRYHSQIRGVPGGWVSRSGILDARGFKGGGCPVGLGANRAVAVGSFVGRWLGDFAIHTMPERRGI